MLVGDRRLAARYRDIPLSQPVPTLELTPGITGRVLYLVGEDDTLISSGQREQIRAALAGAVA